LENENQICKSEWGWEVMGCAVRAAHLLAHQGLEVGVEQPVTRERWGEGGGGADQWMARRWSRVQKPKKRIVIRGGRALFCIVRAQ
jgi:hypothetical protein